jgi:general secretion pathway protein I
MRGGSVLVRLRRIERCRRAAGCREDGFTLLEVLVALGILGLSLSVLLGVFGMALDRTRAYRSRTAAEHLAQVLLLQAETVDPSELADRHGTAAPDLAWAIKTSPYGAAEDRNAWQGAPVQILVQVQWQDHGRTRALSLSTLRIVSGGGHD